MRIVDLTAELNLREVDELLALDDSEQTVDTAVGGILKDVRERGDAAVCDYTKRFDEFPLTPDLMRVSPRHIEVDQYSWEDGDFTCAGTEKFDHAGDGWSLGDGPL